MIVGPEKEDSAAVVQERLRILSDGIEAMRAAVPPDGWGGSAGEITRTIHKTHDPLMTEFIVWIQRWVGALELDIPDERYRPPGYVTLVCTWKPRSDEGTKPRRPGG